MTQTNDLCRAATEIWHHPAVTLQNGRHLWIFYTSKDRKRDSFKRNFVFGSHQAKLEGCISGICRFFPNYEIVVAGSRPPQRYDNRESHATIRDSLHFTGRAGRMNHSTNRNDKSPNIDDLAKIDKVCTEFEQSCQAGTPLRIEKLLVGFQGQSRQQLLLELLLLDLKYFAPDDLEQGEAAYRRRFRTSWPVVATAIKKYRENYQRSELPESSPESSQEQAEETEEIGADNPDQHEPDTGKIQFSDAIDQTGIPHRLRYLEDYELKEEVARGGMGVIYKAVDRRLNREVAIKVLRTADMATEEQIERFHREARTAAQLRHSNIVTVYEVGFREDAPYFSMDFIDGPDLEKFCAENEYSPAVAAKFLIQAADAVHYAHSERILHRDLKPSNLLVDQDYQVHVTDFGLAKMTSVGETITKTGYVMGTPSYMAPEQALAQNNKIGVQTDVYGLGAILYFLLTKSPPFPGESVLDVMREVITKSPKSVHSLNSAVPKTLATICHKCLQKDPQDRYLSAAAVANDLERWLRNEPILATELSWTGKTKLWFRREWKTAVGAVIVVAALLLAFFAGRNSVTSDDMPKLTAESEVPYLPETIVASEPDTQASDDQKITFSGSGNNLPAKPMIISPDFSFEIEEPEGSARGLTTDGQSLWVNAQSIHRNNVLIQYSFSGERLRRMSFGGGTIGSGIAYDRKSFYVMSDRNIRGGNKIFRLDGNQLSQVYVAPRNHDTAFGLTFHKGKFFYGHTDNVSEKSTLHWTDQ